jgi:hypothetical protein
MREFQIALRRDKIKFARARDNVHVIDKLATTFKMGKPSRRMQFLAINNNSIAASRDIYGTPI